MVCQPCVSGMFIPDPDFCPSQIPDPGSKNCNKEKGEKQYVVLPFFVATNITKIKNYFIVEQIKKKLRANLQRIRELFTQKFRNPEKTYSGSKDLKGRHRIPDQDPQHSL
jgi:hypothetical protein